MRHLNMNLLPRGMRKTLDWNKNTEVIKHRSKKYTYILYLTRFQGDRDKLWRLDNTEYDQLASECRGTMYDGRPEDWVVWQSEQKPYAYGNIILEGNIIQYVR